MSSGMKKESASASTFFTIKNNSSIGYFNGNQNFRKKDHFKKYN